MKHLEKENIAILISALEERYKSIHTIRDRVQNIGVWALGIMLATGGYLLQNDFGMTNFQKVIAIVGVIIAFRILRFEYLADLNKGFKAQQKTAARIEKTLGFFTIGVFDNEATSIYPQVWESAGTHEGGGKFFKTTYRLMLAGIVFLVVSIIFSGCI